MAGHVSNSSLLPSAMDLLLVVPRLAQRAGSFALHHMPEAVDNIAGKIMNGGSVIADATARQTLANSTITNTSALMAQSTAAALESALREGWISPAGGQASSSLFSGVVNTFGKLREFGGIFSYLTSKWALTTFTVAIILNRTHFYASSREHLRLRWYMRLALYIVPIVALLMHTVEILQAMRCQTSPDFPLMWYDDPLKRLAIDFAAEGGFLHRLSSTLLFWQDDAECCAARSMSLAGVGNDRAALRGSFSLLYSVFITFCAGQFIETLFCALHGKLPVPETGMTIFEHSLAFAECDAMLSGVLGFGVFGHIKPGGPGSSDPAKLTGPLYTRSELLPRLNVPPEVLLVCLISCLSYLSSEILAVTGLRHKVRLVNTAVWALCYMSAFIWTFSKIFAGPIDRVAGLGLLRFPTICVIGFIPHFLILVGIVVCGTIFGLAILVSALSVPSEVARGASWQRRFQWAYSNLQANVQFSQNSTLRIKMSEDFYTTLLKIGFNVLIAASDAVYLNEGSRIHVAQMTWLEQKRIDQLADGMDKRMSPAVPPQLLGDDIAKGVGFVDRQNVAISHQSPYARERRSKPKGKAGEARATAGQDGGLGMADRRSRMQLTVDFAAGILWLLVTIQAQLMLRMLVKLGIEHRPAWLLKAARACQAQPATNAAQAESVNSDGLEFYMIDANGIPTLPGDRNIDVEAEMRRRSQRAGTYQDEDNLGDNIYGWWRKGGWFGDLDNSGEYLAREMDDDTTSMISMSTNASTADDQSESGRRTPTQEDPYGGRSREATPDSAHGGMDFGSLSRLLNPQTTADRDEARLLSYSLQSERPMTRSQYRRATNRNRAEILTGLRAAESSRTQPPSEDDEERDLEQFILTRRSKAGSSARNVQSWQSGAEGMGAGGPQCVVCQCSPRAILVWPCGCLSMCDDCRVGLAARNYTKCICCRTDIAAYSRLYVP